MRNTHDTHCFMCMEEMDGSEFYDDMCDSCARDEGFIDGEDEDV